MCLLNSLVSDTVRIDIKYGETGHSYSSVFQKCLEDSDKITSVDIEDPYLYHDYQIKNLVRLCELLVLKCKNLKEIKITTNKKNWKKDGTSEKVSDV